MILDGGLATELERRGCDLSDELWSARLLIDRPEVVRDVHLEYLRAGADCIVSASYQATPQGFAKRGLGALEAIRILETSVRLAQEARRLFLEEAHTLGNRLPPVVAASVGPYGAYLADGSEYDGDYGLSEADLVEFHRLRWEGLAGFGADLLACETLPSRLEALALRRLLECTDGARAWFSFSCRDGETLHDGSRIEDVVSELEDCPRIVAVGVNCTSPQYISDLIRAIGRASSKPIVVYPNSGEPWDAERRKWRTKTKEKGSWVDLGSVWVAMGAKLVGGCCRTTPAEIRALRAALLG